MTQPESWKGVAAIGLGLVALVGIFAMATYAWSGTNALAAVGVVASPIVAITAAFFGIQASQAGAIQAGASNAAAAAAKIDALGANTRLALADQAQKDVVSPTDAVNIAASTWSEIRRDSGL